MGLSFCFTVGYTNKKALYKGAFFMKLNKNKISYSPTDLNNFVSCKYHIKNDLAAKEEERENRGHGLVRRPPAVT